MNCENCGNHHDGSYGSGRFCSLKCARAFSTKSKRKEINEKVSKTLKENGPWNKGTSILLTKKCIVCGDLFKTKDTKYGRVKKCCGSNCSSKLGYGLVTEVRKMYKTLCKFNFSLDSYPNEFDFGLIKKYGWYSAKNHGNNLKGISRDHIYSKHNGFKNLINPYLISHPANCNLIPHHENNCKNIKNFLTIEELIERIEKFNSKYSLNSFNGKIYVNEEYIKKMYYKNLTM